MRVLRGAIDRWADPKIAVLAVAVAALSVGDWFPRPSFWTAQEVVIFGLVLFAGSGVLAVYASPPEARLPLGVTRQVWMPLFWLYAAAVELLMLVPDFHSFVTHWDSGTAVASAPGFAIYVAYLVGAMGSLMTAMGIVVWAFYRVLRLVGWEDTVRAAWKWLDEGPPLLRLVRKRRERR